MKTLEDWKNGADYSDEAYEKYHNVLYHMMHSENFLKYFYYNCMFVSRWLSNMAMGKYIKKFLTAYTAS